jgi:HSP20 family protein
MANLIRRREAEPSAPERFDPFRAVRDLLRWDPFGREMFRWDPFAEIEPMLGRGTAVFMPDVEVRETPDAFVFKADLPGIKDEDVDIAISGNRITLSGKREAEERREDERYYAYERSYGSFSRTFTLPEGIVDIDKTDAALENGVLTIQVPKREATQSRRIPIGGRGGEEKRVESTAGAGTAAPEAGREMSEAAKGGEAPKRKAA